MNEKQENLFSDAELKELSNDIQNSIKSIENINEEQIKLVNLLSESINKENK